MIKRHKTREIMVGNVRVGGKAPVSIQSMAKTSTSDVSCVTAKIKKLEKAGCEIVRISVKTRADAAAIKAIKKGIKIPLVADIHFDYRLALEAIKNGADKIRLNPGNMRKEEDVARVVKAAKKAKIPIRIGVNSGSLDKGKEWEGKGREASALVRSAMDYVRLFEKMDFRDIIISLKASDVVSTVEAYREIAGLCDYPLHVGVTAAGPYDSGIVKSAIGIGSLLLDGIGDTIRVSLTADPVEEVIAAKRILSALDIRRFGPQIISCPTCGRCQVDMGNIVKELEGKLSAVSCKLSAKKPMTIAMMGCEVNGPGEACGADIGIAFGKSAGILFKDGKIIKKVGVKDAVKELLRYL